MKYVLSRVASAQIDEIIRYTDTYFGPLQTEEYISGLYHSLELLADNPRMGRRWGETRRRYIFRAHHVYYKVMDDHIFVLEIRNSRQDVPTWGDQ